MKKLLFVLLGITTAALSAFNYKLKEHGLKLPPGFTANVFADDVGNARHLVVTPQGNVYVKLSKLNKGSGIVLLQDLDKNGNPTSEAALESTPAPESRSVEITCMLRPMKKYSGTRWMRMESSRTLLIRRLSLEG
jgi:hypothetical protein